METRYRHLGVKVVEQAVRDFFNAVDEGQRKKVLRELRSQWVDLITFGLGPIVAEQLKLHPKEIEKRFKNIEEED